MFIAYLTEFHKRVITSIFGVLVVSIFGYFNLIEQLFGIIYIVLYSELLIGCYDSKVALYKRFLVFFGGLIYLFFGSIGFPNEMFSDHSQFQDMLKFIISVFAIDTFSYIFGKLLKGPKLFSKISPNKTISGYVFGLIAGVVSFHYLISDMVFDDGQVHIIVGLLFSLFAQGGDLLVSYAKRVCEVKDSSFLLPGHGGFWDRFDSICAAMIFVYLLQLFCIGKY